MVLTPNHYHKIIEFMTNTSAITSNLEKEIQLQLEKLFQLNNSLLWQSEANGNMYNLNFHNVEDSFIWDYTEAYKNQDIMQPNHIQDFLIQQSNTVLTINETETMEDNSSVYGEFIKKHQMIDQMVLYFQKDTTICGGIGFARFKGEAPFSYQEKVMLKAVSKHIQSVIDNHMNLIEATSQAEFYEVENDQQLGIIKLNEEAEVIYFNEDVMKIIDHQKGSIPVEYYYYKYLKPYLLQEMRKYPKTYYIHLDELKVKIVPSNNRLLSSHKYTLYLYKSKKENDFKILLSNREKEVYQFVLKGYTNEQISKALWISVNTEEKHLRNMYDKLNVNNRTALIYKMKNNT